MGQLNKQIKHVIDISIGTKELRELITALAIQGKIVPQVLSEGTASDSINANKHDGIISKKNSSKKLSRVIPVSPPYQIPASWIWIRLQDVCEVNGGFAFQSSRYVNDGIRVVRISDFDDRGFKNDSIVRYDYSAKLEGYLLNTNNIIMAMTGGTVGKSYLVKSMPEKMVVNQRVATIRISKYAIPDFIHFVIKSRLTQGFINSAKNSTNDNISMLDINSFWIPLPPIMEQKRIVEKVDQLMALCDKIEELQLTKDCILLSAHSASVKRLIGSDNADEFFSSWEFICKHFDVFYSVKENVEDLKKAILTLAMKGKLVDQDSNEESATVLLQCLREKNSDKGKADKRTDMQLPDFSPLKESDQPSQLPNGWVWVKLSSVGEINPRNKLDDDSQVGFVPMSLIQDGYANKHSFQIKMWSEVKKGFTHFQEGDIGVAKITPCFENRKSCVFRNLPNGKGAGTTELHIYRDTYNVFDPEFMLLYFKTESFISIGMSKMTGTAGQQRIPKSFFAKTHIPLPPLAEQKRIVQSVTKFLKICDGLVEKLDEAALKQSQVLESIVRQVNAS